MVKVTAQVLDCTSDIESEASESSESSSEEDDGTEKRNIPLRTCKRNIQMDISVNAEDYFLAQSSAVHTSDRTLKRLKNPRLSHEAVDSLLQEVDDPHYREKRKMMKEYQHQFPMWDFLLR